MISLYIPTMSYIRTLVQGMHDCIKLMYIQIDIVH